MTDPPYEFDRDGSVWRLMPPEVLKDVTDCSLLFRDWDQGPVAGIRVKLPPRLGVGRIEMIGVRPSLYVTRVEASFTEDYPMTGDHRMAKVRVLLSGGLTVDGTDLRLSGAGAYLEVDPGDRYAPYTLHCGSPTRFMVVNCRPEFFSDVVNLAPGALPKPLATLFSGSTDEPHLRHTPLGPDLLRAANDIMRADASYSPELRNAFLSVKCQEIACAVVRDLTKSSSEPQPTGLSVRDVNRVYEARDILAEGFPKLPTIAELSRSVGLNRTKLKIAFKAVFGMTIADFTMQCRMDRAADMVSAGELSIAEIAYALGYDHPTNFSATFRAYHGLTPTEVRRANALR
jgi:AraC-like DNA-binding protein